MNSGVPLLQVKEGSTEASSALQKGEIIKSFAGVLFRDVEALGEKLKYLGEMDLPYIFPRHFQFF